VFIEAVAILVPVFITFCVAAARADTTGVVPERAAVVPRATGVAAERADVTAGAVVTLRAALTPRAAARADVVTGAAPAAGVAAVVFLPRLCVPDTGAAFTLTAKMPKNKAKTTIFFMETLQRSYKFIKKTKVRKGKT
jgi:hypothetical protein